MRARPDTALVRSYSMARNQSNTAPVFCRARGFARISFAVLPLRARGDGAPRRRPGCPGVAGLVIRLCPDCSELPHPSPDATAPLGAPFAAFRRFAFYGSRTAGRPGSAPTRFVSESRPGTRFRVARSEEHTSELQSRGAPVCRLLLEKK